MKIILGERRGTASARRREARAEGVWGDIEKPFGLPEIAAAIAETELPARIRDLLA